MIRSIFAVCCVLLYSQLMKKLFSSMSIVKIPWLIQLGESIWQTLYALANTLPFNIISLFLHVSSNYQNSYTTYNTTYTKLIH